MKKTVLSLLALSAVLVACGPSKTYVALEKATTDATVALDTVTSPMSVATIASTWSTACADAIAANGELKGDEATKFADLQTALQNKVSVKSDSLSQVLIQQMTVVEVAEPAEGEAAAK